MYGAPWIEPRRSIIGMFILNYDHGSAAAVNQKLRSLNFHSTRDVDPATYIGLILCVCGTFSKSSYDYTFELDFDMYISQADKNYS